MSLAFETIQASLQQISEQVAEHCLHGIQSNNLGNALACGQFYGNDVHDRAQRGIHGTAAAISILNATNKADNIAIADQLLLYIKTRAELEGQNDSRNTERVQEDNFNTIKLAEILAAIGKGSTNAEDALNLTNILKQHKNISNGSWSFFLNEQTPSDVATCYAVLALYDRVSNDDLQKSWGYLWNKQKDLADASKDLDVDAIARRSLILFTLAVSKSEDKSNFIPEKELEKTIKSFWYACQKQYASMYEVTVEYHHQDKNHYIRIPWQIYLAHALVRVDDAFYYSKRFQKYIMNLNQTASTGGYIYPHAGQLKSTRTNSILYSLFNYIVRVKPKSSPLFKVYDRSIEFWSLPLIRSLTVFVLAFITLSVIDRWKKVFEYHNPLWVELMGSVLITAFTKLHETGKK